MSGKNRILLVDDDADFVRSTADLLEAHGYEVISAQDGASGFEKAKQEHPDLMVLDVMMATQTEGFEVARKIPLSPELRHMPVLLVTGIRSAMQLGYRLEPDETWLPVNRIMEKPIDPAAFVAAVGDLLRRREELDWKHGPDKCVGTLLAAKGGPLHTATPETTAHDAVALMDKYCIGALPIVQDEKLVGICTEHDCARRIILQDRDARTTPVSDFMTRQVVFITPEQNIEVCMALMTHKRVRHLPVLDKDKLVGIVSIGDVVRASLSDKAFLIDQLENYITTG